MLTTSLEGLILNACLQPACDYFDSGFNLTLCHGVIAGAIDGAIVRAIVGSIVVIPLLQSCYNPT